MRTTLRAIALLFAAGCATDDATKSASPRLADDVGGWTPSGDLLDAALALGDRPDRAKAIEALDAMTPARRIDVLRAGLRLRDRPAAIACAARLTYKEMDRWECARAVDLLTPEVFRPGTEANFEEYRSYLGSVELAHVLRSLPPTPWETDTVVTFGQLHRVARAAHLPILREVARGPDPVLADGASSIIVNMQRWIDDFGDASTATALEGSGLPPKLASWLELGRRGEFVPEEDQDPRLLRWCHRVRPGPRDESLLLHLAEHCGDGVGTLGGTARLMLGTLGGPISEAWLRRDALESSAMSAMALARRGVAAKTVPRSARLRGAEEVDLAILMERSPEQAAKFLEKKVFGKDRDVALRVLGSLGEFATPGAQSDVFGIDWRRTSLDGLAATAHDLASKGQLEGLRTAVLGVTIPQCRTRRLAEVAARDFSLRWLDEDALKGVPWNCADEIVAFLETGAPDAFRETLRKIAADVGAKSAATGTDAQSDDPCAEDRERVRDLLAVVGDPAPGESLRDHVRGQLAREERDRAGLGSRVLAKFHDLPGEVARDLLEDGSVPGVEEALRAGRPIDALALVLAAKPDEPVYDIGLVDDPRVRAYLARLRQRRELGHYWYATAELAVLGDPAARAELWGVLQDGRYRVTDEIGHIPRTLGLDLAATMPFWIDELRSQCCRVSNGLQGDIVDDILGIKSHDTSGRTPYERARELWDACGGRFVWSRHLERFVPEPR